MLKNNLKQISLLIGNMFMPMIQKVMPYINAMAIAVKDLIQWISDLFGLKWKNTAQALPDTSEFYSSYDYLVSDAKDAADATDKTADAQKKYNKQLQSFDELNNLTTTRNKDKDKDDDEDNADVSGVLSDALIRAVEDYEKRWNKAFQSMHNSAADLAKTIEGLFSRAWNTGDGTEIGEAIATTLNKAIDWVNERTDQFSYGLNKIASILGTSLNGFIGKFDWPGLGKAIGGSIKAALEAEEVFFDSVNWTNLGKKLGESLNAFIDSGVIQQFFETAASKIKAAIETAFGTITTFKFKNFGTAVGEGVNDFFAKMNEVNKKTGKNGWEELAITFSEGVKGALEAAIATVTTIHWEDIGQAIATLISNMDTSGIGWNLGKLASSLANAFYILVSKRETWRLLGEKIAGGINGFLEGMNEIDSETKLNGWQALGKSISDAFLGFGDTIITALDTIEWEKVGQAIADFITSIDWGGVIWKLGEVVASFAKAIKRALKGAGVNSTLANLVVNVGIGRWIIKKLSKTALGSAIIGKLGKKFAVTLLNVGANIKNWLASAVNKTGLKAKIVEKVGKIATTFKDVGAVIKGWLPTLGNGGKVKDLITGIKAALGIAEGGVFSLGAIKTAILLKLPKIPTFVFPDPATDDLVRQFDQWLYHALGNKDFVEFTVDVFIKIGEFIGDIASQIGNFFGGTWEDTTALTSGIDVGNDLANGILQGFANALVYPVNFLYNLIVKPVKEALGIHSPSTVFKEIAGYCVSGFLDGFNLREKIERLLEDLGLPNVFEIALNVKGNLDEKAKNIKDWFAEKGKQAKDFIINAKGKTEDTFNKVKNAWNSFKEGTKNVAVKAKGKIEDTFGKVKDAWSNFKENTKSLWVKAKGKIEQAFEDVSNAWKNFKDGVKTVWAKAKGEAEDSFKKVFDAWTGVKEDAKDKIVELAVSLSAKKEDIENSLGTIKDKLKDKVVNLGVDLKTKVDDLWNNFRKDYPKLWEKIVTFGAEIKEKASDIWSNLKKENPELWDKIISFKGAISTKASEIWTFVSEKWKDFTKDKNLNIKLVFDFAVSAMKKAINTIISWINSYIINNLNKISIKIPEIKIAGKTLFGGKTFGFNIANIKTLAKGSSGLPADELGIVNDQAGNIYKELIIPPHGKPFIPDGRNVVLPMQKGTRVIPAGKTRKFLEKLPHFANGTEEDAEKQDSKKSTGGITDGVSQAISDTLIPYIREIIRILEGNASSGNSSSSKKKTTTKYSDTVKEIQAAWTGLSKWFESTVVEPIEKGFDTMKQKLSEIFAATNEELSQKYTEISSNWQNTLKEIPNWIKENILDVISNNFGEFSSNITDGLKESLEKIQNEMSLVPDWVENDVASPFYEKFANTFQNISDEHEKMWSGIELYSGSALSRINFSTESSFTEISKLVSELERRLGQITMEVEDARENINETADKVNETKKQAEEISKLTGERDTESLEMLKGEALKDNKNVSELGTFQDLSKNMVQEFSAASKEVNSFVQNASRPIENLTNNVKDAVERLRAASQGKVKRYATGGFPEDGWFRASHGEMIGRFDNGQSVVANNRQITDGIADAVYPAVYNAMMAAISSSGSNGGDIVVQIDGENIFRVVRNKDQDFYNRTHRGAFEH